ncbi:MAG: DinB family protein [Candidatus Bathyarchaeota archaeon]
MDIKNLFEYNWYARRKFLKSINEIPWEIVTESYGASFDSIRDIFIHSLQSEQMWIRRLSGKSIEGIYDTPFTKFHNVNVIEEYADKVEAETNEYLKTLTDEALGSVYEFKGRDGKINRNKVEDILMHVIEEEIHHRGELICIYAASR